MYWCKVSRQYSELRLDDFDDPIRVGHGQNRRADLHTPRLQVFHGEIPTRHICLILLVVVVVAQDRARSACLRPASAADIAVAVEIGWLASHKAMVVCEIA